MMIMRLSFFKAITSSINLVFTPDLCRSCLRIQNSRLLYGGSGAHQTFMSKVSKGKPTGTWTPCNILGYALHTTRLSRYGLPFLPEWRISLLTRHASTNFNRFRSPPGGYKEPGFDYREPGRERGSKLTNIRKRLWYIVRVLLLGTGAVVWVGLLVAYLSLEEVKIQEVQVEDDSDVKLRALIFYDIKKLSNSSYFKKVTESQEELEKIFSNEDVKDEMFRKGMALTQIWEQLRNEESIRTRLGIPAQISGYKCARRYLQNLQGEDKEPHQDNMWNAECFVEGPVSAGVMALTFERSNVQSEWVPTSVHLESMHGTGEVLCNVARPLPHGLKNFTRLSN